MIAIRVNSSDNELSGYISIICIVRFRSTVRELDLTTAVGMGARGSDYSTQ